MPQTNFNTAIEDWTDLPLHTIIYEWSVKNMYIPKDLVAYLALFLIMWYTIIWIVRLVMSIIWPLFIISMAIIVFRILQFYEPEEIVAIVAKSFSIVADAILTVLDKLIEIALSFFD